jgi:NADPH2:quinone reductase
MSGSITDGAARGFPEDRGRRVAVHQKGGPRVLAFEPAPPVHPDSGHAIIRNRAIGVNFIDVYHRNGLYPRLAPFVPGVEGAGTVESLADDAETGIRSGDRVGYIGPFGAYATHANVPIDRLIPLPDDIPDQTAAAVLLQGITAYALLNQVYPVRPGETILIQAAAGGLGLLLCQWASALGATVIGTVSTSQKAELARGHGCHHPLVLGDRDWVRTVREITAGVGVPVVYDSVGKDTFEGSLDCLSIRGVMVSLGQSSGPPEPMDVVALGPRGSLTVVRPSVFHYVQTRPELLRAASAVFSLIEAGQIDGAPHQVYPLADAAQAHEDLEARKTTGAIVLLP